MWALKNKKTGEFYWDSIVNKIPVLYFVLDQAKNSWLVESGEYEIVEVKVVEKKNDHVS